jgi:hypothetical protein
MWKSGELLKSGSYLLDVFTQLVRHCFFLNVSTLKKSYLKREKDLPSIIIQNFSSRSVWET